MALEVFTVFALPLLNDVVFGWVEARPAGSSLEPLHLAQIVLVQLLLRKGLEQGEITRSRVVGPHSWAFLWLFLLYLLVLFPPFLGLYLLMRGLGLDSVLNRQKRTLGL